MVGAQKRKNQYRLRREAVLLHRLIGTIKPIKSGTKGIILWESLCCSLQQCDKKVQVGKDQEKAQSEKDSHSKNRGGKKPK